MGINNGQSEKKATLRTLRPLFIAALAIFVLAGIEIHKRLSQTTTISLNVTLEGRSIQGEFEATCDGVPFTSGSRRSVGSHRIEVRHPKTRVFSTNIFLWYGSRNLGTIDLARARGTLSVSVHPSPQYLNIQSGEFQANIIGGTNFSEALPTGVYHVDARYQHHDERRSVAVQSGDLARVDLRPQLGALLLKANRPGAHYIVFSKDGSVVSEGQTPRTLTELPAGEIRVLVKHQDNVWEATGAISPAGTNTVEAYFAYGALSIETRPPGAAVLDERDQMLGRTPILISDLKPGVEKMWLRLDSFEPVLVSARIEEKRTNLISERLLRSSYVQTVNQARSQFSFARYDDAISLLESARKIEPDDHVAKELLDEYQVTRHFAAAEAFARQGDYGAAVERLRSLLGIKPRDERASEFLAECEKKAAAKAEHHRMARLNSAKTYFGAAANRTADSGLFETHTIVVKRKVKDVQDIVTRTLETDLSFRIKDVNSNLGEGFEILAEMEFLTTLKTIEGKRVCLIVGSQVTDEDTELIFKVLEFRTEPVNKFSIGNLIGASVAVIYRPIHKDSKAASDDKFQARLREGSEMLKKRLNVLLEKED